MTAPRQPESGRPTPALHGLSPEAQAALIRRSASHPGPADQLLAAAVPASPETLTDPVMRWAKAELEGADGNKGAFTRWESYADTLGMEVPATVDELLEQSPRLAPTLERLFNARQALADSRKLTPTEENIGETMRLVLVPWRTLLNLCMDEQQTSIGSLQRWVNTCLSRREGMSDGFRIAETAVTKDTLPFTRAFLGDANMYRQPGEPTRLLRLSDYLAEKIDESGPWGLILTQTGHSGGYYDGEDVSSGPQYAGDWTSNGKRHFQIAGYNVDAMGVYEYIARLVQEDDLSEDEQVSFLLLANRVSDYEMAGRVSVPHGYYTDEWVRLLLRAADNIDPSDGQRFSKPPRILLTVGAEQ